MSDEEFRAKARLERADPARILVVDDNRFSRKKLKLAVEQLGHIAETAEDGESALLALSKQRFDAVLLDILMPGIDGFDVLRRMKSDSALHWVPVIVVSSLDDDTESVVRAIELGAKDFLPKNFDPVILRARLATSLAEKRFRDQEIEYFGRVEKLTTAAETVETGRVDPRSLKLDELAAFNDPLGRLAAVFRGMASEIHKRELRMVRTIHTLQGIVLLIAGGLVWGLNPALSRMASGLGSNPIGLAVWVNIIAAVFCLAIALFRGKLHRITRSEFMFFVAWAVLAGIFQRLTIFTLAGHVEATILSLIVSLQGFIVFAFAAVWGGEKASPRRLLGLTVGLVGVTTMLLTRFDPANADASIWLIAALALPALLAIETIALADRRPTRIDQSAAVGIMFSISVLLLVPMAYLMDELTPIDFAIGRQEVVIVLLGLIAGGSNILFFQLIATAGSVFASQSGYVYTLAGIMWGILLLGEEMHLLAWLSFVLILIGMYLVEPKASSDNVIVKRSFAKTNI